MYLLYSLLLTLLFLALLPYFIYQSIRHGKYASNFTQRMGRLPSSVHGDGRPTIWAHAVSVGEFNAARPLLETLRRTLPGYRIVVSTTTITGQRLARAARPGLLDAVFYFPFDWAFAVRRALTEVSPAAVVILETELWPNFLRECRRRGVPTIIVNGRISPRSFARYRRVRRFIGRVLNDANLLVMQSAGDAERARSLGADPARVRVCGNLKYDVAAATVDLQSGIDEQFALSASPHLIVAGSTAPGEEEMLVQALREVRQVSALQDARLLIAPRRPERFDEVAALLERSGFQCARRSRGGGETADIILLDTIGELAEVYRYATVVFVGGSLVPRGGHNIIEPAAYAKPILVGPHTENFRQVIADFAGANAVTQVEANGAGSLAHAMIALLSDPEMAREMGERARALLRNNQGATECAVAAIRELLGKE
ncbi:MAG TPA: 3-deoxy-D-manno-octulosonic acid transferase [Blastocatellia bacterium]|nr:3-deoxy-D-manno-octulosonic acid transferase [Blastocatellia bacterium]